MNTAPDLDEILGLSDEQILAMHAEWRRHCNSEAYLSGRTTLAHAAGPVDPSYPLDHLLSDETLAKLEAACRERAAAAGANTVSGAPTLKGLISAVRWAYLAARYPGVLTSEQHRALTAAWTVALGSPGT